MLRCDTDDIAQGKLTLGVREHAGDVVEALDPVEGVVGDDRGDPPRLGTILSVLWEDWLLGHLNYKRGINLD